MNEYKMVFLWSIINGCWHSATDEGDHQITQFESLVGVMFPGFDYSSMDELRQAFNIIVIPALRKQFPFLIEIQEIDVNPASYVEVAEVLPSDECEWRDDAVWRQKFDEYLAA